MRPALELSFIGAPTIPTKSPSVNWTRLEDGDALSAPSNSWITFATGVCVKARLEPASKTVTKYIPLRNIRLPSVEISGYPRIEWGEKVKSKGAPLAS